jgi:hypothetical protein
MPMNTGIFWQVVRDVNDPVPLHNFNGWAMNPAIESPAISAKSWRKFVINFFSNQMEYFDASHHFKGQRRSVGCDYWSIVFAWVHQEDSPADQIERGH